MANFIISSGQYNAWGFLRSTVTVLQGGAVYGGTLTSCTTTVQTGGMIGYERVNGGVATVMGGATMTNCIIENGATVTTYSNVSGGTVGVGGHLVCGPGVQLSGILTNQGITDGGALTGAGTVEYVLAGTVSVQSVNSGATIVLSGGSIGGIISLMQGGSAVLAGNPGGTVNMAGGAYTQLTISGGVAPNTLITGFNGASASASDQIRISGLTKSQVASVSASGDQLTLRLKTGGTMTLNIQGVGTTGYTLLDSANGLTVVVCYLAGTMIRTIEGTKGVDALKVGDFVVGHADGKTQAREVIWTGQGYCKVDETLEDDRAGYPVCIRKGAIGEAMPDRDMHLTAEHCLFIDGVFVPVRMLVNGHSIFYDRSITEYTYYHFETREHSVVVADGLLSESYLDTGNRHIFAVQSAAPAQNAEMKTWERDAAAPLCTERLKIEPIHRTIAERCGVEMAQKVNLTNDPGLYLETNQGVIVKPLRVVGAKHIFQIPPGADSVVIRSRTARPCDIVGPFVDDRRSLGVLVGQVLQFVSGRIAECKQHLTDCEMSGWHRYTNGPARWTAGDAFLFLTDTHDTEYRMISLEIVSAGPYLHDESAQSTRVDMCAG